MGGRPQKREKASGRKEWELGSTWNLKWTHVGIGVRWYGFYVGTGLRCPRFTLPSFYVGTLVQVLRCPRFTLVRVYVVYVGTLVQVYGFTVEAGDVVLVLRWDAVLVLRWDVGTGLRLKRGTGLR